MSRFPTSKKLISALLLTITIVLAFSALFLGIQMVEAQRKVHDLQSQIAYYENITDNLQTQVSGLEVKINGLQNPIDNATLTILSNGPWHGDPLTGYPYYKFINITLQNFGTRSIGGMTLDFQVFGNTTNIGYYDINVDSNIGVLHVLESKSIMIQLISPTKEGTQALENCRLTITLKLDMTVLDRKTVTIGE
jgi:hypothetical protein